MKQGIGERGEGRHWEQLTNGPGRHLVIFCFLVGRGKQPVDWWIREKERDRQNRAGMTLSGHGSPAWLQRWRRKRRKGGE